MRGSRAGTLAAASALALALVASVAAALSGCSGGRSSSMGSEAGPRDATVVDGTVPRDASPYESGTVRDAAPADAGPLCPTPICDPRELSSCAPGTCALTSATPDCISGVGIAVLGQPCSSSTDCAAGLGCFAHGSEGGICGQLCCPGDGTCTAEMRCAGTGQLVDGTETPWGRCMPPRSCDVLHPERTCEPDEGCYIVTPTGATECLRAGTADVGQSCSEQNDCAAGLFCAGVMTARVCRRICSLADAGVASCPTSEGECRAYAHSPDGTGLCTTSSP